MLSLIGKDLRAGAPYIALKIVVLGLLLIGAVLAGKVFLVLSCVIAGALVALAPALDWSLDADTFVHSLPASRSDVVRARYATSVLLSAGWLALAALIALGFASRVADGGGVWPAWVALETALTAVVYVSVFIALFLASVFRFGTGPGGLIAIMAFAVLAPLGIRVVRPEALAELMASVGAVVACAGVVMAMAAVIWVSMRASMRCYERREF